MSRPKKVPAYKLHKPSGQARVILDGEHLYLGPYGSADSREKYARLIAERFRPGGAPLTTEVAGKRYPDLTVNELLLRFLQFAEGYYVKDGKPTGEIANFKDAMRSLRALYSHTLARDFGPLALKAVQQYMIQTEDLSRKVINHHINRIRRIFKWAVSEELLPSGVLEAIQSVSGLRRGRSGARETLPVRPVDDHWVEATLNFLPPQVADMVRLQRLTGMRPGDVCLVRPCDLDRSGPVWLYEPQDHKTAYLDRKRLIPIGPKARAIIEKYINRPPTAYLFSPVEVMEWRREQRRQEQSRRRTKVYPCELRRLAREKAARKNRSSKRAPRDRFTTNTYRHAIGNGIEKANQAGTVIPNWHPNQLRHSRGTEVRRLYGLEGAQVVLGHASADITQVYAERDLELAKRIAKKTG